MKLEIRDASEFLVVTVREQRIDAAVAIRFKDQIREVIGRGAPHVVFDLSEVEFVDSSGLGAIVAAMKQMGSTRRLDLAGLTPAVERVFRLTRMDTVFTIHTDVAQAEAVYAG
ncbi:STAS domain-containing protein [Rhodobacteraceae bacterium D3-12]|nr:STAS domain-containing protein [Rhodobacteraceae bacterium D3-12]